MNRSEFIKNVAALGVAPSLLAEILDADGKTVTVENHKKKRVAIDLRAIENIGGGEGGKKITPADIIRMYLETGILIYRMPYNAGPDYKAITIIDE